MTGLLSPTLAERAFFFVRPAIEAVFDTGVTGRAHLAVVVTGIDAVTGWRRDQGVPFAEACYLVTTLGDLSTSPWPNTDIALKKAELSARYGLPGAQIAPGYLQEGDSVFSGSAVIGGVVAACAGLDPRHDEMFSWWIASAMHAQAQLEIAEYAAAHPQASFWRS
ncbi:hypothetical protein GVN24_06260 [Rhizobium sp. CRIBSB]|nr:hypothetical protein [Rhizobium sp. CRIBSB]